jgi:hypothetical protein
LSSPDLGRERASGPPFFRILSEFSHILTFLLIFRPAQACLWGGGRCGDFWMCGIVGILGREPVAPLLVDALKRLEYRGYDSAGVATLESASSRAAAPAASW